MPSIRDSDNGSKRIVGYDPGGNANHRVACLTMSTSKELGDY